MKILLTGGAGFIGSHVAEHLLARGHDVAVVDDLSTGKRGNVPEDARFYEADVRSGCDEVFADFRPDALSHHAAQIDLRRSLREPDLDAEVNVLGTIRVLENCVRYGVRKVAFASTGGAIYGEQKEFPAAEDHPQHPLAPYGVAKLAGEQYLRFYGSHHRLSYAALRYANVYGPRQNPYGEAGVVAIFCRDAAEGVAPTIFGTGEQTRDFVYVGDVARANALALEGRAPDGAYNIGTGIETTLNGLVEMLRGISDRDLLPEYAPGKPGEQARSCVDPRKASRLLGWRPEVNLAAGLAETLKSFAAVGPVSRYEPVR